MIFYFVEGSCLFFVKVNFVKEVVEDLKLGWDFEYGFFKVIYKKEVVILKLLMYMF